MPDKSNGRTTSASEVCIRVAAIESARHDGLDSALIESFLRTGDGDWDGSASGCFGGTQLKNDELYRSAARFAMRQVFDMFAELLPASITGARLIAASAIKQRVEPMIRGVLIAEWQDVAMRVLIPRIFVLNYPGARMAFEAEIKSCTLHSAWQVLWAFAADFGLKPDGIAVNFEGTACEYAHVRLSSFESEDAYSDVVVHETAHLLHYLKPQHHGLTVRRGQERFVDVEFKHREQFAYACEAYSRVVQRGDRKSRVRFVEGMVENAFSFPVDSVESIAGLVADAARSRNGWRVIREATVARRTRARQTAGIP